MAKNGKPVSMRVRLPMDLHRWIAASARREHRSMNAQIRHVLEDLKDQGCGRPSGSSAA